MKFLLVIVSLISFTIQLSLPSFKVGQNVSYDTSNCEFNLEYTGPNRNMLLMFFNHENQNLTYEITCPKNWVSGNSQTRYASILYYIIEAPCSLKIHPDEKDSGTFIFYDFKAKFKIKLRNKYGNTNIDFDTFANEEVIDSSSDQLTFLVPNFRANLTIKFEYQKQASSFSFTNPFKVCHENVCKENIDNYYFVEGKSYEIYVKTQKVKYGDSMYYIIAPFSFYPKDYDGTYYNDDLEYSYDKESSTSSKILLNYLLIYSLLILLFI